MPTYAILGATGNMGSSLLTLLTTSQAHKTTKINLLVRSKAKLEKVSPSASKNPNVTIYEGSISDSNTLRDSLTNVSAIFLAVAVKGNTPGTTIAQDTAKAVVSALSSLRSQALKNNAPSRPPKLIVLSSASVSDTFWTGIPDIVHNILFKAMYHVYTDLALAETYLRSQHWLHCTFVMPGGIAHDVQRGHVLSETEQQTFISFLDVAAGMIEVADEESGRWDGKQVSVIGKEGVGKAKFAWEAPVFLCLGLLVYFFPWLHHYLS